MRTGRPKATLILTDAERQQLASIAHRSQPSGNGARGSCATDWTS